MRPGRRKCGCRLSQDEVDERLRLYFAGQRDHEIGLAVGRSATGIRAWREALGLPRRQMAAPIDWSPNMGRPLRTPALASLRDPQLRAKAIELYLAGGSATGIARMLNVPFLSLYSALSRSGMLRPLRPESWIHARGEAVISYVAGATLRGAAAAHEIGFLALRGELRRRGLLRPYARAPRVEALLDPRVMCMLGCASDQFIAKALGCGKTAVWRRRTSLGIAPYRPPPVAPIRISSIDAPRPLGGSFHDVQKDDTWSDWLEEAGATVW